MKEFIYYNTNVVTRKQNDSLPGIVAFRRFFSMYPQNSVFIDRTHTVKIPIRVRSLYPIPALRPFKKTYAEVCEDRGAELIARANTLDARIYVAWSGGIDSTVVLVSLLKAASPTDRKRIVVLLTRESIAEYPEFYANHIRGQLACDSMSLFPYLLGTDALLIGGENNDQVFGSDISAKLINMKGPEIIHKKYDRGVMTDFFTAALSDATTAAVCTDLMERIAAKAPIELNSHFDYLWWLSFCVKWQFVATRMLPYTLPRNAEGIKKDYLGVRYDQFFNTENFQLWSMLNTDKKIKDAWNTYKWPAKDVIYAFAKDEDYRKNKQKRGSLSAVLQQQLSYNFVDSTFNLYPSLAPAEYYEPDNDFV